MVTLRNLKCVRCGHPLTGLKRGGVCVECGAQIELIIQAIEQLDQVNPRRSFWNGALFLSVVHVLALIGCLLFGSAGVWIMLYIEYPILASVDLLFDPTEGWWVLPTAFVGGTLFYGLTGGLLNYALCMLDRRTIRRRVK